MAFAETLQAFFMKMMHKLLYVNQSNKWACWKFWIENPYIVGKNLYTQLVIKFSVSCLHFIANFLFAWHRISKKDRKKSVFDKVR